MKAIRVHGYGGVEVLNYEEVPKPEPGEGQVRVKLEAVGVNFIDIYHRIGRYQGSLPLTLGQEGGGVVDAVGANVTEVKPGDRVVYAGVQGSYAEYAIVPASSLVPVPQDVDLKTATAVTLQGITAHYLALSTYPLKQGDTALVHAAGGGAGGLLVQ
ncbi:MAG TPA: alcohol dehydrogenase catalytic domain-containing protein, partial [Anaerolineales bacterium]|nr:alcohol dehydrogenase catalytic domain-containing protein [Anaerolineales bacterium]